MNAENARNLIFKLVVSETCRGRGASPDRQNPKGGLTLPYKGGPPAAADSELTPYAL